MRAISQSMLATPSHAGPRDRPCGAHSARHGVVPLLERDDHSSPRRFCARAFAPSGPSRERLVRPPPARRGSALMPRVNGVVLGPDDRPVRGAAVLILDGPGTDPDIGALTRADGTFQLTVHMPGTYRVGVFAEGRGSAEVEVNVPAEGADVLRIRLN
jgi:hypothetical protein